MTSGDDRKTTETLILDVANSRAWREPLSGLATEAIERWVAVNRINPDSMLLDLVYSVSEIFCRLAESDRDPSFGERAALMAELRAALEAMDAELAVYRR